MITLAIVGFTIAGACAAIRLFRGPALVDRIIALDVLLVSLMGAITVHAGSTGTSTYLIALIVLAIVGFTATFAASRFIHAGAGDDQ